MKSLLDKCNSQRMYRFNIHNINKPNKNKMSFTSDSFPKSLKDLYNLHLAISEIRDELVNDKYILYGTNKIPIVNISVPELDNILNRIKQRYEN